MKRKTRKQTKTFYLTRDLNYPNEDHEATGFPDKVFIWNKPQVMDESGNFGILFDDGADPYSPDASDFKNCIDILDHNCQQMTAWEDLFGINVEPGTCIKMALDVARPETKREVADAAIKKGTVASLRAAVEFLSKDC